MKKLFSIAALAAMLLMLSVTAFADTPPNVIKGSVSVNNGEATRFSMAVYELATGAPAVLSDEQKSAFATAAFAEVTPYSLEPCPGSLDAMYHFTQYMMRFHLTQAGNSCYVYNQNVNACNFCPHSYLVGGEYAQEHHTTDSAACKATVPGF